MNNRTLRPACRTVLGLWVVFALLLLATPAAAQTVLESRAREIDNKLMAPCCGANTVRDHDSAAAMQMRDEIRRLLAAGQTEQEILDHFVAQHGEKILAMPKSEGFNLLAYLLPVGFLVFGVLFLTLALLRWRRKPNVLVEDDSPSVELDPVYLERLEREVRKAD